MMLLCSEVKTLSILTAIFQAIGQVITHIFPVSESGHSAIFHDFSSRFTGSCSELTGLVHIGIAVGVLAAFWKVFLRLVLEFVSTGKDIFTKKLDLKKTANSRKFMYYTFIPYIFMLAYLIPVGNSNIYGVLHAYSYDGNLVSEGICFLIDAVLLLFASFKLKKNEKGSQLSLPAVLVVGCAAFFSIPVSGLSLCALVISILALFGTNPKIAFRYFVSLTVPILLVRGIIEIATCVSYVNIAAGIIGVVIAVALSYIASKLLLRVVKSNSLGYFSYYGFAIGGLTLIIGIIEIFVRK